MIKYLGLLLLLFSSIVGFTGAELGSTGMTGATGTVGACPETPGEALFASRDNLKDCSVGTLRAFYQKNDCCISQVAECNNILDAFYFKVPFPVQICNGGWLAFQRRRFLKNRRLRRRPRLGGPRLFRGFVIDRA